MLGIELKRLFGGLVGRFSLPELDARVIDRVSGGEIACRGTDSRISEIELRLSCQEALYRLDSRFTKE